MYRGTTPEITIKVDTGSSLDLSLADEIWVTFKNISDKYVGEAFTVKSSDGRVSVGQDGDNISVTLSQDETLEMREGKLNMQVRLLYGSLAYASNIGSIPVKEILGDGVMYLD